MKQLAWIALASCLVWGCDQKEKTPDTAPEASAETSTEEMDEEEVKAPDLAPEIPKTDAPMLATPSDFELEASESIALENLEAELDRLDAEIRSVQN